MEKERKREERTERQGEMEDERKVNQGRMKNEKEVKGNDES